MNQISEQDLEDYEWEKKLIEMGFDIEAQHVNKKGNARHLKTNKEIMVKDLSVVTEGLEHQEYEETQSYNEYAEEVLECLGIKDQLKSWTIKIITRESLFKT